MSIDWEMFDFGFFKPYGGVLVKEKTSVSMRGMKATSSKWARGSFLVCAVPLVSSDIKLVESPWYPWFGGECPVPGKVRVDVTFRDGGSHTTRASFMSWEHTGEDRDIIAFRITGEVYE